MPFSKRRGLRKRSGFTMIELLVVISLVVVGILLGFASLGSTPKRLLSEHARMMRQRIIGARMLAISRSAPAVPELDFIEVRFQPPTQYSIVAIDPTGVATTIATYDLANEKSVGMSLNVTSPASPPLAIRFQPNGLADQRLEVALQETSVSEVFSLEVTRAGIVRLK